MVEQIGNPTVFFTLSEADYQWYDLLKLLCPDEDPLFLDDTERRQLMHDNSLLVSWFFTKRVELFMSEVLVKIFKVRDFWYRIEWQARGSPHVHGLLWFSDAPKVSQMNLSDDELAILKNYFDQYCFAVNADIRDVTNQPCRKNFSHIPTNELANDLTQLLNYCQRHTKHGKYCLRKMRNGTVKCRFTFPKNLQENSSFVYVNGMPTYEPIRNDQLLQRYNPLFVLIWRANTDCSPVMDKRLVTAYIAKYASKPEGESKIYKDVLKDVFINKNNNTVSKSIMKCFVSTIGNHDYSAQEVLHLLMEWPLFRSSRNFTSINLSENEWHLLNVSTKILSAR